MSGLDEQGWKDKNWLIAAFWEDKTELFQGPSFFGGTVHRYYLKTYFGMMSSMTNTFCRISLRNSNFLRFWWMCECAYKERLKAKWYDTGRQVIAVWDEVTISAFLAKPQDLSDLSSVYVGNLKMLHQVKCILMTRWPLQSQKPSIICIRIKFSWGLC